MAVVSQSEWDSDDHILVLPGLPPNLTRPPDAVHVYPSSTIAFVKSMRASGVPIELAVPREQADFVSHNAADLWLPILQFGAAMLAGASGNLISSTIEKAISRVREPVRVHLDVRVKSKSGEVRRFKFDGPVKDAKAAIELFERSLPRPDEDD